MPIMTVLDTALIAIMIFFLAWGTWVGLIRQLALVTALLAAFAVTGTYAGQFHALLSPPIASPRLSFILTYLLLLLAVYGGIRLLIPVLRRVVNLSLSPWFDRMLGGAFGGAKAYLLMVLFYLAFSGLATPLNPLLQNSYFSSHLATGARCLQTLVRDQQLREIFIPQAPAISAAAPVPGTPPSR